MPCRTQEIQNCAIPKTRQTFEKGWKTKSEPKRSFLAIFFLEAFLNPYILVKYYCLKILLSIEN